MTADQRLQRPAPSAAHLAHCQRRAISVAYTGLLSTADRALRAPATPICFTRATFSLVKIPSALVVRRSSL